MRIGRGNRIQCQQQGIAIRLGSAHRFGSNCACRTRAVLYHNRLTGGFSGLAGQHATQDIQRAACHGTDHNCGHLGTLDWRSQR